MGTNNRFKRDTDYTLHGHTLEVEQSSKYLGLNISKDLLWKHHVEITANTSKACKTIGFLRRNLRCCSKHVRNSTYTSLVNPTVEYTCAAWNPLLRSEDVNRLDQVQRAARFICNNYSDKTRDVSLR